MCLWLVDKCNVKVYDISNVNCISDISPKELCVMNKFILAAVEKMGNWFGIIFKILLPFVVMYRPIKTFVFLLVVTATAMGGDSQELSRYGILIFCAVYALFTLLLIFFPKIASAAEFFLMFCYFAFFVSVVVMSPHSVVFANLGPVVRTYSKEAPVVFAFFAGKIYFFFFIRANRAALEKAKSDALSDYAKASGF